jgi:hypothetical protein
MTRLGFSAGLPSYSHSHDRHCYASRCYGGMFLSIENEST